MWAEDWERRKAVEQTIDDLYDWIGELHAEIEIAKKEARAAGKDSKAAKRAKAKADEMSDNRLALLKVLRHG